MDAQLYNVADLSSAARAAVESLLGQPLRDEQRLYLAALDVGAEPSANTRRETWEKLEALFAQIDANVDRSGVTPDDLERIIDESCEEVRYGKQPCE